MLTEKGKTVKSSNRKYRHGFKEITLPALFGTVAKPILSMLQIEYDENNVTQLTLFKF